MGHRPRRTPRGEVPFDAIEGAGERVKMHLRADSEHLAHETIRSYFRERDEQQRMKDITDDSPVTMILDDNRLLNRLESTLGTRTIGDLRRITRDQMLCLPQLGPKAWEVIEKAMNKWNVSQLLKGSVEQITGGDDE